MQAKPAYILMIIWGFLCSLGTTAGAGEPAAGSSSHGPDSYSGAPAPEEAAAAERFPYRLVGLGGSGYSRDYIVLTDGFNSLVALKGDVVGDRYRIDALTSRALAVTDLATGERHIIIPYKQIQHRVAEATSKEAPVPAVSYQRPREAAAPAYKSRARPSRTMRRAQPETIAPADTQADEDKSLQAMIAPPPVNRAEQAMPMEMTPPPAHNPMVITMSPQEVPMIVTPSRREHQAPANIPLGPGN